MATNPKDGGSSGRKSGASRRPRPLADLPSDMILPPDDAARELEQFKKLAVYLFAIGGALIGVAVAFTVMNVSFAPHRHPAVVTDAKGQERPPTDDDRKRWDEEDALHEKLIFTDHLRGAETVVLDGRRFDAQMLWLLISALIFAGGACFGAIAGIPVGLAALAAVQKNRPAKP